MTSFSLEYKGFFPHNFKVMIEIYCHFVCYKLHDMEISFLIQVNNLSLEFPLLYIGREELLTEHALQWNRKKVEKLPQSLAKRYTKVGNVIFFLV